jgi:negative regulator of flagellin synthesis FlgM
MKVSDTYGPQQVQVSNHKDTAAAKEAEQRRRLEQQDQAARQAGDKVEISSASREVAKARDAAAAAPESRSEMVAEIKARVDQGTYEVDARQVADRMLMDLIKDQG